MMRTKEKGFTTLELLVCFIITSVIMLTMFTAIMSYRERQQIESIRNRVMTYDYTMTKMVQDDVIKRKLIRVQQNSTNKITMYFERGSATSLTVDNSNPELPAILYGPVGQEIRYPLPAIDDLKIENTSWFQVDSFLTIRVVFAHPDLRRDANLFVVAPIG